MIANLTDGDFEPIDQDSIGKFSFTSCLLKLRRAIIGMHNKIFPVFIMNDNSNPVLTSNTERGALLVKSTVATFGGTGTQTRDFIVPQGKKWKIKSYETSSVATLTSLTVLILDPSAVNLAFDYQTTGLAEYVKNTFNDITLPQGWTIRFSYAVTVDGSTGTKLLIQEISEAQ